MITGRTAVARWASANSFAIDRVCITVGALIAWVADTSIFKVTEKTCASMWTLAEERCNSIMTGCSTAASSIGAVINIFAAILSRPAVDTNAVISTMGVVACTTILASIWHQLTFIDIFSAVLASPLRRTLAVIGVHAIHTGASILAVVSRTIVNVLLTVLT